MHARATRTLEKSILQGTTHMRTHLEVDPGVGLRSLEGVLPLIKEYAWAIDLQICVFPQEGLLNNPGTDELMVEALDRGCRAVGGAPYIDTNPPGQIDRVFELAREFDVDVDHASRFRTDRRRHGPRACLQAHRGTPIWRPGRDRPCHQGGEPADAGLRGGGEAARRCRRGAHRAALDRSLPHGPPSYPRSQLTRGVVPAHKLLHHGVNCSLSSNNVLNPFTPFGDCSQMRMANLYANICQVGKQADMRECFNMVTQRPARLMRLADYGLAVGKSADLVVLDSTSPEMAVAELAPVLYAFKRGRKTVSRQPAMLHRPQ